MRWILIALLICNGVYFLWHNYLLSNDTPLLGTSVYSGNGNTAQIALLSEPSAFTTNVQVSVSEASKLNGRGDGNASTVCWLIGPFTEEVSSKQVVGRLEVLNISLQLTSLSITGRPDYWVHLEPLVSRRESIKLLRQLNAKNIDSFLITKGALENGISLGVFTQHKRAIKLSEERVAQGYEAKIKEIPRVHTQVWAVFDTGKYGKFTDKLWGVIKKGNSRLERQKNYCDKIASIDNLD
ncbi:MAG: hypothetical protein JKX73_07835 [Flavobacteriales bacterium]|nr:hypothetical protein [Flavobacteriales bacterium]